MTKETPEGETRKRFRAIVHGRVQGVNFRYYTRQRARGLGVTGFVRNRYDGTVEVVAEGGEDALRRLLSWLHAGPSLAQVTRVDVEWGPPTGQFVSFEVRH
ncbi:MAG: acylphosphatase [Chloroflexi bacterium]|nr:acylphosphatase [Chloroflexota bacterium]